MYVSNEFCSLCQPESIYSYIDTIGIYYERKYPTKIIRNLSVYGNRIICRKFNYGTWIQAQQPNDKIFYILKDSEEVGKLVGLDVAIDFESHRPVALANYLINNIQQKHRRKNHRQQTIGNGTYFREKRQVNRNILVYGDKLSKITGKKCAHLELRVKGAQALKRLGIDLEMLIKGVDIWWLVNKFCRLGNDVGNALKMNCFVTV